MSNYRRAPIIFSVGFFLLLAVSAVMTVMTGGAGHISAAEYRKMHNLPPTPHDSESLAVFTVQFDAFMRDNFGFRNSYFQVLAQVCSWLGVTPGKYQVVRGRDGWFFTAENHAFEGYSPRFYFTDADVERWRVYLEAKHRWAASIGAKYFFLMVPNSNTIYHDKLPQLDTVDVMQSRMTQIFSRVQQPPDAPFMIDPRAALFQARKESLYPLYYKTDTHWNFVGAAAGFSALMSAVQQAYPDIRIDQYPDARFRVADRSAMGYVGRFSAGEELHDYDVEIADMPDCSAEQAFLPLPNPYLLGGLREPLKTVCPTGHSLKVLVFHDSFFDFLQPMLSAQFQEVSYLWLYNNNDEVNRYYAELLKPDIIIEEVAERFSNQFRDTALGVQP